MASLTSRSAPASMPKQIAIPITRVPTSGTDLIASDAVMFQMSVCNTTGSSATITIVDKNSTPRYVVKAAPVAANTTYVISWPEGIYCKGGINWTSSADAFDASVVVFTGP